MSLTRSYNPIWNFFDLVGHPVDDTYWFFTLQNSLPYLPQPVYLDQNGTIAPDPIQLLANGTLPDLYWDNSLVYRIELRHGPTQADALVFALDNYIPIGNESPLPPGETQISTDNQVTNPQFSLLNFVGTFTTTTAGTFNIAPGWQIVTTGSGTVSVTQDTYEGTDSNSNSSTNASYGLSVTNNGFTKVILRQRFNHNGALWTGATGLGDFGPGVAVNFTASSSNLSTINVWIRYNNADGEDLNIADQTLTTSNVDYQFASPILQSNNSTAPATAWTDLDFEMIDNLIYHFTSIQLVGQEIVQIVPYLQTSLERQQDQTFHYYNPQLQFKPIASLLTGWDFPLNPTQILGSSSNSVSSTAGYVWDQTIMATSASTVTAIRDVPTGNLKVTTGAATQAFYLLQYLSGSEALKTTLGNLSVNINAYATVHGAVSVRCYLFNCGLTSGSIPTSTTGASIGSVAANGVFTASTTGWVEIAPLNGVEEAQTLPTSEMVPPSFGDTQFISYVGGANYNGDVLGNAFAIVVTFSCPTSGTVVNINSISCVPGDIATRPAPQTVDEVQRECEYYYEKSYKATDLATSASGAATSNNSLFYPMSTSFGRPVDTSTTGLLFSTPFTLQYKQAKRVVPTVYLYSVDGTVASVQGNLYYQNGGGFATSNANDTVASFWTATKDIKTSIYTPNSLSNLVTATVLTTSVYMTGGIKFQYLLDARLGVV